MFYSVDLFAEDEGVRMDSQEVADDGRILCLVIIAPSFSVFLRSDDDFVPDGDVEEIDEETADDSRTFCLEIIRCHLLAPGSYHALFCTWCSPLCPHLCFFLKVNSRTLKNYSYLLVSMRQI
jgi:hypothetical protein